MIYHTYVAVCDVCGDELEMPGVNNLEEAEHRLRALKWWFRDVEGETLNLCSAPCVDKIPYTFPAND